MRSSPLYIILLVCLLLVFAAGCGGTKLSLHDGGSIIGGGKQVSDDPPPEFISVSWYPMFSGNQSNDRSYAQCWWSNSYIKYFHPDDVDECEAWATNFTTSSPFGFGNPEIFSIPVLGEIHYQGGVIEWCKAKVYAVDSESHLLSVNARNGVQDQWVIEPQPGGSHYNFSSAAVHPSVHGELESGCIFWERVYAHYMDCAGHYYIYEDDGIGQPDTYHSPAGDYGDVVAVDGSIYINENGIIGGPGAPAWQYAIASPVLTASDEFFITHGGSYDIQYVASFFAGYHPVNADNLYCCRLSPKRTHDCGIEQVIEAPVGFSILKGDSSDVYKHIITTPALDKRGNVTDAYVVAAGIDRVESGKDPEPAGILCRVSVDLYNPPLSCTLYKQLDDFTYTRAFRYYELPNGTNEVSDIPDMTLTAPVIFAYDQAKFALVTTPYKIAAIDIHDPGSAGDLSIAKVFLPEEGRVGSMPVIHNYMYHDAQHIESHEGVVFFVENSEDGVTNEPKWRMLGRSFANGDHIVWRSSWIEGEHSHSQPIIRNANGEDFGGILWNTSDSGLYAWKVVHDDDDDGYIEFYDVPEDATQFAYTDGGNNYGSLSSLWHAGAGVDTSGLLFQANSDGSNGCIHAFSWEDYTPPPAAIDNPPSVSWPQAGNDLENSSYQDVSTGGALLNTYNYADSGPGSLAQAVVSDKSFVYKSDDDGSLYGIDMMEVSSWCYIPPDCQDSIAITPAWCNPDSIASNGDERVYYVYQDTSNQVKLCSVNANDGTAEWTVPIGSCNMMLRSSPVVDGDYIYLAQGVQGYGVIFEAHNRVSGSYISGLGIPGAQAACTPAVDSLGYIYLLYSDHAASWLTQYEFNGTTMTSRNTTPSLPGDILLNDPGYYDTQHGPVVYSVSLPEYGSTEFVAFSLADLSATQSGGVYAYQTSNFGLAWSYVAGLGMPAICSGLAVNPATGTVYVCEGTNAKAYDPATDTYGSKMVGLNGATGAGEWLGTAFSGRVGSAPTISSDGYLYCQSRFHGDCSLRCFDLNVSPSASVVLPTTHAGIGPVTLSLIGDSPGVPTLFYLDSSALGGLNCQY